MISRKRDENNTGPLQKGKKEKMTKIMLSLVAVITILVVGTIAALSPLAATAPAYAQSVLTVDIRSDATEGVAPATFTFEAVVTRTADIPPSPLEYIWIFGDGTSQLTRDQATVTHTYNVPGTYTVTVNVRSPVRPDVPPATDSLTVTVTGEEGEDITPPVLIVPELITKEATGPDGAEVSFEVSADDDIDGSATLNADGTTTQDEIGGDITISCTPASGSTFPIQIGHNKNVVTCTATDAAGNTATAQFTVTVTDTTPPVITVPEDMVVGATIEQGAAVSYTATATDAVDGDSVSVTCTPESGSIFPIGTTTVTCTAVDAAGNEGTASFTVTVTDTTSPVITVPEDITVVAPSGAEGAVVQYQDQVSAEDDVDGPVDVTCTPASGSTFPIGTTTVNCEATDAAGNTSTKEFTVTVNPAPTDTTAPVITIPEGGITAEATSAAGAVVSFEEQVSAEDDVDGPVDVTCTPASGSTFPIGTTTVNCEATDAAGNVGTALFTVTVNPAPDTTAPDVEITGAVDRSGRAITDGGTTPTNYIRITFEATDEVGIDNIGCSLDGGEDFEFASCTSPVVYSGLSRGTQTFTVRATDAAGNSGEDEFTWTISKPAPSRGPPAAAAGEEQAAPPAREPSAGGDQ